LFRPGVVITAVSGALLFALPPQAAAQWRTSGNISLVSDYVYRGYSRSAGGAALQAGIQLSGDRLSVGTWASQVELLPSRTSSELDFYAHWRQPLSDQLDAGLTATYYSFPGDPRSVSYDYAEFSASLDWRQRLRLELAWSPEVTLFARYQGPLRGNETWSVELTATQPLRWGLVGFAGIGRFDAPQLSGSAYTYGNIGISRDFGHWHAELAYFDKGEEGSDSYILGSSGGPWVATLAWHF
jgi:uncharacterized protein (TIGR02001 family)